MLMKRSVVFDVPDHYGGRILQGSGDKDRSSRDPRNAARGYTRNELIGRLSPRPDRFSHSHHSPMPRRQDNVNPGSKNERDPTPLRDLEEVRSCEGSLYAEKQAGDDRAEGQVPT